MLYDLLGGGNVPTCERPLAAMANGGGEDRIRLDGEIDRGLALAVDEGHGEGRFHLDVRGARREEEERTEHVLVGLGVNADQLIERLRERRMRDDIPCHHPHRR